MLSTSFSLLCVSISLQLKLTLISCIDFWAYMHAYVFVWVCEWVCVHFVRKFYERLEIEIRWPLFNQTIFLLFVCSFVRLTQRIFFSSKTFMLRSNTRKCFKLWDISRTHSCYINPNWDRWLWAFSRFLSLSLALFCMQSQKCLIYPMNAYECYISHFTLHTSHRANTQILLN